MLVYFGVSPDANPRRQSVEYRWRWVLWCWPCIFHVYFMYILCYLCIIFRVGYAKISQRKGSFQWNMAFKFVLPPTQTPQASQWNRGCLGSPTQNFRIGYVHFMLFVLISFTLITQREPSLQLNMGFSFRTMSCEYYTVNIKRRLLGLI